MSVAVPPSDPAVPRSLVPMSVLDRLTPLHVALTAEGRISGLGPTLRRLIGGDAAAAGSIAGLPFDTGFTLRRPADLALLALGGPVELTLRDDPRHPMNPDGTYRLSDAQAKAILDKVIKLTGKMPEEALFEGIDWSTLKTEQRHKDAAKKDRERSRSRKANPSTCASDDCPLSVQAKRRSTWNLSA